MKSMSLLLLLLLLLLLYSIIIFLIRISWIAILAIFLMIIGAFFAGINDLEYNFNGYFWIMLNCIISASYILYMRFATINIKLSRFGMVYYNNLMSAMILFPLCLIRGDFNALKDPEVMTKNFIIFNIIAGIIGFYLNFASLWCIGNTSATTYAIVGTFNKVPVTILGQLLIINFITIIINNLFLLL